MVAALVLGTNGAIRGGSSPLPRTRENINPCYKAWVYIFQCVGRNSLKTVSRGLEELLRYFTVSEAE